MFLKILNASARRNKVADLARSNLWGSCLRQRRDSGQHSSCWLRLLSVLCLHKHDKLYEGARDRVYIVDICSTCCHFHERKLKGRLNFKRQAEMLRVVGSCFTSRGKSCDFG